MADKITKNPEKTIKNSTKLSSQFLYKALIVAIFLVLVPLFPLQAPEFINQAINTRGWEFLHLVFVSIAVSYGLFSRRNDVTDKDDNTGSLSTFENAQSYVSGLLQVSSIFDDDDAPDSLPSSDNVQTWSSQYVRNEPPVVIAEKQEQHCDLDREKPLLLPVRSLKSRVFDSGGCETGKDSIFCASGSLSRSNSNLGSKGFSSLKDLDEKENIVLPSPIPWRSRSGRIEMKEPKEDISSYPSMEESEFSRSSQNRVPNSTNSPRKLSPSASISAPKKFSASPSLSAETQGKIVEDFVRKKSFYKSPPPPPPPPPPTLLKAIRKSRSMKPSFGETGAECHKKDFKGIGSLSMPRSARTTRINYDLVPSRAKEKEYDKLVKTNKTERLIPDRVTFMPQPTYREFPKEEKEETVQKFVMESDEDLAETEDDLDGANGNISASTKSNNDKEDNPESASDEGPDVDRKADEFIAKFREQIRLQRIESIKKSSGQINKTTSG